MAISVRLSDIHDERVVMSQEIHPCRPVFDPWLSSFSAIPRWGAPVCLALAGLCLVLCLVSRGSALPWLTCRCLSEAEEREPTPPSSAPAPPVPPSPRRSHRPDAVNTAPARLPRRTSPTRGVSRYLQADCNTPRPAPPRSRAAARPSRPEGHARGRGGSGG